LPSKPADAKQIKTQIMTCNMLISHNRSISHKLQWIIR